MDPDPTEPAPRPRRDWFTWLALLAFAGLLLSRRELPLWLDEAWTVEDLLGDRLMHVGYQVRERAYEGLLSGWIAIAGAEVARLRLLMTAFGLAAVYAVGRAARAADAEPATAALLFTAFSTVPHYLVEINRYAEITLGAAVCTWALLALRREVRPGPCVALVVAGVGAFYIHHTTALTILAVTSVALLVQRQTAPPAERRARTLALVAVVGVELLLVAPEIPWLLERAQVYGAEQSTVYAHVYRGLTPASLAQVAGEVAPGAGLPAPLHALAGLLMLGLVGWGLRAGGPSRALGLLALGPLAAAALGSLSQPMFVARVLLPALPAAAVLAARAGRQPTSPHPWLVPGVAVVLALSTWVGFLRTPWPEDMRATLTHVRQAARAGDGLVVHPPFARVVLSGNLRAGVGYLPALQPIPVDAPTALRATQPAYAGFPPRTLFVLGDFRGFSRALEAELPRHFADVRLVGTATGYRVLIAERPLPPERVLAEPALADEPPALTAYRRAMTLLHADRPADALPEFQTAQAALPTGLARDAREAQDDRGQVAWGIAYAAHRAGQPDLARQALRDAEAEGVDVAPAMRAAILGE